MLHCMTFQNCLFKAHSSCSYEHSAHLLPWLKISNHNLREAQSKQGKPVQSGNHNIKNPTKLTLAEWYSLASNRRHLFSSYNFHLIPYTPSFIQRYEEVLQITALFHHTFLIHSLSRSRQKTTGKRSSVGRRKTFNWKLCLQEHYTTKRILFQDTDVN